MLEFEILAFPERILFLSSPLATVEKIPLLSNLAGDSHPDSKKLKMVYIHDYHHGLKCSQRGVSALTLTNQVPQVYPATSTGFLWYLNQTRNPGIPAV